MARRSSFFILPLSLFLLPCSSSVSQTSDGIRDILLVRAGRDTVTLKALDSADVSYLPLEPALRALAIPFSVNDTTRKLEFLLGPEMVKVTDRNPFVILTERASNGSTVYQLPNPVRVRSGEYFVPLAAFTPLLGRLWPAGVELDSSQEVLTFGVSPMEQPFDIVGIDVEHRLNGYLMTVRANRKLTDYERWLSPDGWLFLTLPNATADTLALQRTVLGGAVRQLLVFQSPSSVQLTFRVAPDVEQAEISPEPGSNNLLISLRTKSEAEKKELEKKRQDMVRQELEKRRSQWKLDVIVIDAGHGGKDPGALGVTRVREKDVTLAIALRLGKLIEQSIKGVRVVYTRKTDRFVELYRRTEIANKEGGKLFVSIHCNSRDQKPSRPNGFEIYLLRPEKTPDAVSIARRENAVIQFEENYQERYKKLTQEEFIIITMAQSAYVKYSENFAEVEARSMAKGLSMRNSGVHQAGFYVLVGASMPNVLVETGYLSNRKEELFLKSSSGQKKIAEALFKGIKEYKGIYERALQEGKSTSVN